MRIHRQVNANLLFLLLAPVHRLTVGHRTEGLHCLTDKPDVEVEANSRDVPRLLGTQHVAGSTHLEVLHRDGHTRAELIVLRDGGQSVIGGLGENLTLRIEEVGVGPLPGPTHAPAQLVQLG